MNATPIQLSIFIPVLNEAEILEANVMRIYDRLHDQGLGFEVIVVSNGSTDETNEIGQRMAEEQAWFRFFILPEKGPGRAFVLAMSEARSNWLVTFDADLSSGLDFLESAVTHLPNHAMVVGSKTVNKQSRPLSRIVGSKVYIGLTQRVLGLQVNDFSMGNKAFRLDALLPIRSHLDPWTAYPLECAVFLKNSGHSIVQVGVHCNDNREGRFSLLHEGVYRYRHLMHCVRLQYRMGSWLNPTRRANEKSS